MKIMICPLNGPRNISEFAYGGEVRPTPGDETDNAAWTDYLFSKTNLPEVVREWWYHVPTSYWFIAERDLATDTILKTYPADQLP